MDVFWKTEFKNIGLIKNDERRATAMNEIIGAAVRHDLSFEIAENSPLLGEIRKAFADMQQEARLTVKPSPTAFVNPFAVDRPNSLMA